MLVKIVGGGVLYCTGFVLLAMEIGRMDAMRATRVRSLKAPITHFRTPRVPTNNDQIKSLQQTSLRRFARICKIKSRQKKIKINQFEKFNFGFFWGEKGKKKPSSKVKLLSLTSISFFSALSIKASTAEPKSREAT